ncbi:hypothetical protein [Oryza sativa Japonica Group]|uniref:Uncharacterized protein n=1 Tax=Oryza sativa subsp. japonica TaxID=39947 RepID=Q5JNI2_ORYSJ|nr:hypothetical protein [Oryza sativa Japonica Group]
MADTAKRSRFWETGVPESSGCRGASEQGRQAGRPPRDGFSGQLWGMGIHLGSPASAIRQRRAHLVRCGLAPLDGSDSYT